jgi:hypothetical protein
MAKKWLARALRAFAGLTILLLGVALVLADARETYLLHGVPHYVHLGLGVVLAWVGGYIMVPALADQIASEVFKYVGPYLPKLRLGGDRATDPATPEEAAKLEKAGVPVEKPEPPAAPPSSTHGGA